MDRKRFEETCDAASAGERRHVRNRDLLYTGEVLSCGNGRFEVDVLGHRTEWPMEKCDRIDGRVNPLGPPSSAR